MSQPVVCVSIVLLLVLYTMAKGKNETWKFSRDSVTIQLDFTVFCRHFRDIILTRIN